MAVTASAPTVLVLTQRIDATADLVVTALAQRGANIVRCDIADFPQRLQLSALFEGHTGWHGTLSNGNWTVDLGTITGAYYRRPTHSEISPHLSDSDQRWAATEALAGFGGLLAANETWLNHPHRIGFAEYKPVQLAAAARAGLATPRTLITNDPASATRFVRDNGEVIYKAFSSAIPTPEQRYFIYASKVGAATLPDQSVSHTAHLFQQWVDKVCDVRVTVVDEKLFAARIQAQTTAGRTDWRSDYAHLRYEVIDVPDTVAWGIRSLLTNLGLRFAALDFAIDADGTWVFLDLNPNGQWAWIENETKLPICAAITAALLKTPST